MTVRGRWTAGRTAFGVVLAMTALLFDAATAGAQSERLDPRKGALEFWGALSGRSPQWGILGETPHMRFGQLAVRLSRPIGARAAEGEFPTLEWTIDVIPLARLSPPLVSLRGAGVPCPTAALCVLPPDPADGSGLFPPGAPLGAGIAPLGLVRRFHRRGPVSPWIGVSGGALLFSERVPTTQAAQFNFTASAEVGLRFGPPTERGITLAYRFHHISNAGTAGENPGVASHLLMVGMHRPRR
ncbi:MAG: acyloxyacyl hydrolase [Gemmatimonadaceae bacterium]|nr:acyloxyacyl hydrolase [Gemmatimonadaceae bacterium]